MFGVNWWGIMFFVFPMVLILGLGATMLIVEILRGLWGLVK